MLAWSKRRSVASGTSLFKLVVRSKTSSATTTDSTIDQLEPKLDGSNGLDEYPLSLDGENFARPPESFWEKIETTESICELKRRIIHEVPRHRYKMDLKKPINAKIAEGVSKQENTQGKYSTVFTDRNEYTIFTEKNIEEAPLLKTTKFNSERFSEQSITAEGIDTEDRSHEVKANKIQFSPMHLIHPKRANPLKKYDSKMSPYLLSLVEQLKRNFFLESNFGSTKFQKTRLKVTEKYLENLNTIRHDHPFLKEDEVFNHLAKVLKIVNSGKVRLLGIDCATLKKQEVPSDIGIAIYHPSGQTSILPDVRCIHIRIRENSFHADEDSGHRANTFLGGNSIMLRQKEAKRLIDIMLEIFFDKKDTTIFGHQSTALVSQRATKDIEVLKKLGVTMPEELTLIDTSDLLKCTNGPEADKMPLSAIYKRLNMMQSFSNNAGNDAYYTLMLLLKISDPGFRKAQKVDDYKENLKYEEEWAAESEEMKRTGFFPEAFFERDRLQWNIHEFSPPEEVEDLESALEFAFKRLYR